MTPAPRFEYAGMTPEGRTVAMLTEGADPGALIGEVFNAAILGDPDAAGHLLRVIGCLHAFADSLVDQVPGVDRATLLQRAALAWERADLG